MSNALGPILISGVAVGLSPIPLVAVILMVTTPRGKVTGPAFLVGWIVGLAAVTGVVLVSAQGSSDPNSTAADGANTTTLVIGLLFLFLALQQWRKRPKPGEEVEMPKWMAGVDHFNAGKSLVLGIGLAAANPKNLALSVSAAVAIAQTGASDASQLLGAALFLLLGCSAVIVVVVGSLAVPQKIAPALDRTKGWMATNNHTIMFVICLLLGASRTGEGLAAVLR